MAITIKKQLGICSLVLAAIFGQVLFNSCAQDNKPENRTCQHKSIFKNRASLKNYQYNYIVLLDLSGRIVDSSQFEKDIAIINSIYCSFETKIKFSNMLNAKDVFSTLVIQSKDEFQYFDKLDFEDTLSCVFTELELSEKKYRGVRAKTFNEQLSLLYDLSSSTMSDNESTGMLSEDVIRTFRDILPKKVMLGDSVKNLVFLITDGNINPDAMNELFSNITGERICYPYISVMMLEMKDNGNGKSRVWNDWFRNKLNIPFVLFNTAELSKKDNYKEIDKFIYEAPFAGNYGLDSNDCSQTFPQITDTVVSDTSYQWKEAPPLTDRAAILKKIEVLLNQLPGSFNMCDNAGNDRKIDSIIECFADKGDLETFFETDSRSIISYKIIHWDDPERSKTLNTFLKDFQYTGNKQSNDGKTKRYKVDLRGSKLNVENKCTYLIIHEKWN